MYSRTLLCAMVFSAASVCLCATVEGDEAPLPDLTRELPADISMVQHLGPTGLQGWMHVEQRRLVPGDIEPTPLTVDARQIYITAVDEGSPADGIVQNGDVVLGIGEKLFDGDPRVLLAEAINDAETKANGGSLKLLCWRPDEPDGAEGRQRGPGSTSVRQIKLKVLGTYSDTAPYHCEKSEAILKQTVDAMLSRMNNNLDLPYLALLATGEAEHFEIARKHILSVAASVPEPSIQAVNKARSWGTSYRLILLCEYYLITRDEAVMPAIRNLAVTLSMGQSIAGMWGHAMAQPSYNDGRLHGRIEGYAALNQPSLTCFMGLVLASKCGVEHPELTTAIEKANAYFRHFVGKGAMPYGHGPAREFMQTNNGTSGSAALAFAANGDRETARFFALMCAGAYAKLEMGHTGTYFNTLWTGLGANLSGPEGYAAFFKRWTWLRTLARKWDGGFVYQGPRGGFNYRGLSADAAMVLHYALPRRKLLITGREQDESLWLKGTDAEAAASVWTIDYASSSDDELLKLQDHDIPMVRGFAAKALATRGEGNLDALKALLKGSHNEKIGACNTLAGMQAAAVTALPELMALVRDESESPWTRSRAVVAIAATGEAGTVHVRELLTLLMVDRKDDSRRDFERYVAPPLAAMVKHPSFDHEAHKDTIYPPVLRLLHHPHEDARSSGMAIIDSIELEDFHLFAESIVDVIINKNQKYTQYHGDNAAKTGLSVLNRLNIEDGITLAIDTIYPGIWGQYSRITGERGRLALLKKYGANVKPYIPRFREVYGEKAEETIKEIERSTVIRNLITMEEAIKAGKESQKEDGTDER